MTEIQKYFPVFNKNNLDKWPQSSEETRQFLLSTIRTLFFLIKEFAFESEELRTIEFKKKIDELSEVYVAEDNFKILQSTFKHSKKKILTFTERQKKYLKERESEFIEIIDILTDGMISSQGQHQAFNQQIYDQSENIEKIILLDDIKKIKDAIQNEILEIKNTIWEKQVSDKKQIEKLSKQVESLRTELEKKKPGSFRDPLTGLYNRQAFDMSLSNIIQRNEVTKTAFSLSFVDISSYESMVKTFGKQIGDRIVLAVVQGLGGIVTSEDLLARYEEKKLAIILHKTPLRQARKKIARTVEILTTKRYSVNDAVDLCAPSFLIALDVGVSMYRKGDTAASVTERALRALEVAKQSGKNIIITEKSI